MYPESIFSNECELYLSSHVPIKYKDPGSSIISCDIREIHIEKALLDLGASKNILSFSVYKQLGLEKLQPIGITLQLADRSLKISKGMVEDVLIKIDNFIFFVDFIILEIEPVVNPKAYISIILERPFLATVNIEINCQNGLMKLSFENMTIELNIFNLE